MPLNNSRLLLAKVRSGDYAHPGEEEAIDLVLERLAQLDPKISLNNITILDVGCGLGGTADYFRRKTNSLVVGFDKDKSAVEYAGSKYKQVAFYESDANKLSPPVADKRFNLIYMFNVLYSISDPAQCLEQLRAVASSEAILVIFDYTWDSNTDHNLYDFSGTKMCPLNFSTLEKILEKSGWQLLEKHNLSSQYLSWYETFINLIQANKTALLKDFTLEAYNEVFNKFSELLKQLRGGKLGGGLFFAQVKLRGESSGLGGQLLSYGIKNNH